MVVLVGMASQVLSHLDLAVALHGYGTPLGAPSPCSSSVAEIGT